jgi:DTW domain-containing protein YfiP
MHVAEKNLTSNTARLATHALVNSEIRLRGLPDQRVESEGLGENALVLFPSDDAEELTPELVAGLAQPVTLVVPDGTWRQARKAAQREPGLQGLRRVKLPAGGPPSEYRLRVEPNDHSVCTFEAIARALGVLEGPEVQAKLETLFRVSVGRTLWARGLISASEVPGGIPAEAMGARG